MPRQIPITEIVDSVLDGYIEAQKTYEIMSGGLWLWQAPEYFITSTVARCMFNLDGQKFITMEHGSSESIENAGAKGKGRLPTNIRAQGKVDMLLWWANGTPRAIIELKNQIYSKDQYEKDILRIESFLRRNCHESSFQFGLFSFYESGFSGARKSVDEKICYRVSGVYNNAKEMLGPDFDVKLLTTDIYEDIPDNAWQAACLIIKRKT